jgi:hypothetical protein
MTPLRQIRARFDDRVIVVYQAYSTAIADPSLVAGRFVAPFSFERMTWVKPSFAWLMERCGWATKPDQERVLAVHLRREAFDQAVRHAVDGRGSRGAPLRLQWDPERDLEGRTLPWRSLQLGIGPAFARAYAEQWVVRLEDLTSLVTGLRGRRAAGDREALEASAPAERPYPLDL